MIVRPAHPVDFPAIRTVVSAAFGRADEADMIDLVRTGGQGLVELVAEVDGAIAGHVLFSRMTSEPAALIAGLAPLAVDPGNQGCGIGSALARRGLEICRELGAVGSVVLGAPAYYGRFGFRRAPATITCRYASLEAFQALAFAAEAFARPMSLAYPPAFD
ncbi:MAG TPA: N-acetyltransferase [Caulobacteraceae bacterium]